MRINYRHRVLLFIYFLNFSFSRTCQPTGDLLKTRRVSKTNEKWLFCRPVDNRNCV